MLRLTCDQMNPFISFCLYVAARVFVQYLKSRPKDTQIKASLQFLLSAMHAIKRKNPLTESFLVQLDVDLEGAGLDNTTELRASIPAGQNSHSKFGASGGCPNTSVLEGDTMSRPPTYGDIGLAAYNDPNAANSIPVTTDPLVKGSTFGSYSVPGLRATNNTDTFIPGNTQFELQNRQQRSPGSQQSPRPFNPDMDTSPDGSSGNNDRPTPNSSTQSQHNFSSRTSNSTYSPQNLPGADMGSGGLQSAAGLYDQVGDGGAFSTDFDMHAFPASTDQQQPNGFVLFDDSAFPSTGTGFTPGPSTGFTPGPSGMAFSSVENMGMNLNEFSMNGFAETAWDDVMASLGDAGGGDGGGGGLWETHVEVDMQHEHGVHERLAKRGLLPRNVGGWGR